VNNHHRARKPVAQLGPVGPEAKPDVKQVFKDMLAFRDQQKCTLGGMKAHYEPHLEGRGRIAANRSVGVAEASI
jgi:hypothetical protein